MDVVCPSYQPPSDIASLLRVWSESVSHSIDSSDVALCNWTELQCNYGFYYCPKIINQTIVLHNFFQVGRPQESAVRTKQATFPGWRERGRPFRWDKRASCCRCIVHRYSVRHQNDQSKVRIEKPEGMVRHAVGGGESLILRLKAQKARVACKLQCHSQAGNVLIEETWLGTYKCFHVPTAISIVCTLGIKAATGDEI